MHPWLAHLHANLVGDSVSTGPKLRAAAWTAVTETQRGLAWHEGELLVGVVRFEFVSRGRDLGAHAGLLVTDRRVVGRTAAMEGSLAVTVTDVDIPYAALTASKHDKGLLTNAVVAWSGAQSLRIPMFGETLDRLFRAVGQAPPGQRTLGPLSFAPTADDPSGAMAAWAVLVSGDPRPALLVRLVHAQHAAGALSFEHAQNLLLRAVILDRTIAGGRGMNLGAWLSVLPRDLLRASLQASFGQPVGRWGDHGSETYDFALGGGSGVGRAAASTALGLASLAVLGVGWVSIPGARGLAGMRLTLVDYPCGSGFVLLGSTGGSFAPLPLQGVEVTRKIHEALLNLEGRFLLLHALDPGAPPTEALFAVPPEAVAQRVAALAGPTDLSAFLWG